VSAACPGHKGGDVAGAAPVADGALHIGVECAAVHDWGRRAALHCQDAEQRAVDACRALTVPKAGLDGACTNPKVKTCTAGGLSNPAIILTPILGLIPSSFRDA
jgi:hypothetical protein